MIIRTTLLLALAILRSQPSAALQLPVDWADPESEERSLFDDRDAVMLLEAVGRDDRSRISELVGRGAGINAVGAGGVTPLLRAMVVRNRFAFERLLVRGANPNWTAAHGSSAVHMAAADSSPCWIARVMQFGGDPDLVSQRLPNNEGRSALYYAMSRDDAFSFDPVKHENFRLMIAAGADTELAYKSGSPLRFAAHSGRFLCALILASTGSRGLDREFDGETDFIGFLNDRIRFGPTPSVYPSQRRWYWKCVGYFLAQGESFENVEKVPGLDEAIRLLASESDERVDYLGIPGPIEFDGRAFAFSAAQLNLVDEFTQRYSSATDPPEGPHGELFVQFNPHTRYDALLAAEGVLRVIRRKDNPGHGDWVEHPPDSAGNTVIEYWTSDGSEFIWSVYKFQPTGKGVGGLLFGLRFRVPADDRLYEQKVAKIRQSAAETIARWSQQPLPAYQVPEVFQKTERIFSATETVALD